MILRLRQIAGHIPPTLLDNLSHPGARADGLDAAALPYLPPMVVTTGFVPPVVFAAPGLLASILGVPLAAPAATEVVAEAAKRTSGRVVRK